MKLHAAGKKSVVDRMAMTSLPNGFYSWYNIMDNSVWMVPVQSSCLDNHTNHVLGSLSPLPILEFRKGPLTCLYKELELGGRPELNNSR